MHVSNPRSSPMHTTAIIPATQLGGNNHTAWSWYVLYRQPSSYRSVHYSSLFVNRDHAVIKNDGGMADMSRGLYFFGKNTEILYSSASK